MIKSYHQFDISIEGPLPKTSEEIGKKLVKELKMQRYKVFTSNHSMFGVPTYILVGSERDDTGTNVRSHIYPIFEKFNLKLKLVHSYRKDNPFL